VKTAVVGLGLIGGSVLRGLARADVRGFDADPAVRAAAVAEGFTVVDALAGLADRELVIVAVPPGRTPEVVATVLDAVPGAVVADTASVKETVLAALPGSAAERVVGAHPLAGAETAGWRASSADVVAGALWAVCPLGEAAPLEPVCRLAAVVDRLGGRLLACTAPEHDEAVARTSHVPHLTALALARNVAGAPLRAALSGPGLRDATRVARADPVLWADILLHNRARVVAALDGLTGVLGECRAALEAGDRDALARAWSSATDSLAAVDAARWTEPAWREEPVEGGWAGLLALGREGRAVRRLRLDGAGLRAEVAR
jgi:prephenate dehydrogenase